MHYFNIVRSNLKFLVVIHTNCRLIAEIIPKEHLDDSSANLLTTFVIYEFCVFDLVWHVLFFIPNYYFARNALLQRPNGETRSIFPTIIEIIDISHDRFLAGNMAERSTPNL